MGINRARIFQLAKGFRGRGRNCWKIARQRVESALQHAYRGRREKKRVWRSLAVARSNAAGREHGLPWSRLSHGLRLANVTLNRKSLAELAMNEPLSFRAVVEQAKFMLGPEELRRRQQQHAEAAAGTGTS
jgi:large subunit ribosomal protein L20